MPASIKLKFCYLSKDLGVSLQLALAEGKLLAYCNVNDTKISRGNTGIGIT